MKIRS